MRLIYYENKQEYSKISRGRKDGIYQLLGRRKQIRILDIGCGRGLLGSMLKKDFQAQVHGVDISVEAIKAAQKNLDGAWQMDLEADEWPAEVVNTKYDALIISEVLEHLFYPESLLEKIKQIIVSKTEIIITVPNLLFWKNRLKIFFGYFEYENEGFMDRGHIHFFSWVGLRKMIKGVGYSIVGTRHYFPTCGTRWLGRLLPGLLAYQFIIKIKKNEN